MKKIITALLTCLILVGATFALTACGGGDFTPPGTQTPGGDTQQKNYSIKNIAYVNGKISWDKVDDITGYKIYINGAEKATLSQHATSYYYAPGANDGTDFDFTVEALIKEGVEMENPFLTIRFVCVGKPTDLAITNGYLTWTAVDNADYYEISIDNHVVEAHFGGTEYLIPTDKLGANGSFRCKVTAKKNESIGNERYYFVDGAAIDGRMLSAPTGIQYNPTTGKVTWEKVSGAGSYTVKIGNEEIANIPAAEAFYVLNTAENFTVSVRADGSADGNVCSSAYSEAKTFTFLKPITGLRIENGALIWDPCEGALGYRLTVDGTQLPQMVNATKYTQIQNGKSYNVKVQPVGGENSFTSPTLAEINFTLLSKPVNLRYQDGNMIWELVQGAAGYNIKIDRNGQNVLTQTVGPEEMLYPFSFEEAGEYQVAVQATATANSGIYESGYTTPYIVKRLSTPVAPVISSQQNNSNMVQISFSAPSGATRFSLQANGVEITQASTPTFSLDVTDYVDRTEESVINFKIYAIDQVSPAGAVLASKTPLEVNVTRLAVPQNLRINGMKIEWDSVSHTSEYYINISGTDHYVTTNSYILTSLAEGATNIMVYAKGNGQEVLTSGASNPLTITKLHQPTNLQIADGLLTWNQVEGATGYKVNLGAETYSADTNFFNLLAYDSYIKEGLGTKIQVLAVGNGADKVDSDFSASKTYSRYQRPTNVKAQGDNLVWNVSSVDGINCNDYKLIISTLDEFGQVVSTEEQLGKTGSSYPLSFFTAGKYSVRVVAIGDLSRTVNSPESDAFTFTKLPAVTDIKGEGNAYTWGQIAGNNGYEIKLSAALSEEWVLVRGESYIPTFGTEGEFEVSIRALGNGVDVVNSDIYTFTQRVTPILEPNQDDTMTLENAFKVEKSGNVITVTVKKQAGGVDYKLFVSSVLKGTPVNMGDTVVFTFTMTTPGATYDIQVQVIGNEFADNGVYTLNSNKSTIVKVKYQ